MDTKELALQKKFLQVYDSLQKAIDDNYNETNVLGWQQRNELITHVYSNYNNHEKLNAKRNSWEKSIDKGNILKWLNKLFSSNRDLFGYFNDCEYILTEIEGFIALSISKEKYEIAQELNFWKQKLSLK